MLINVTTDDIRLGVRRSITHCPIALAVKRNFPNERVRVGSCWMTMNAERFDFNDELITFITDFDDANSVEPFSFDLKINPSFPE